MQTAESQQNGMQASCCYDAKDVTGVIDRKFGEAREELQQANETIAEWKEREKLWAEMMDNKEKASIELHETIAALRVEIERHKLYDLTAAVLAKDMETTEERDQWRSMAERLAEALEYMLEGGGDNHVSESALAEFEKLKAQQQ